MIAKKPGTAIITCAVGNKKCTYKIKVLADRSSFTKKTVKNLKVKSDKFSNHTIDASWKKISEADGYEVQFSENKNMLNTTTFETDSGETSMKITMYIEKGKSYYVKVRAYKEVQGYRIYSKWSGKKKVKVK